MTDLIDLDISNLPKPWTLKQAKFAIALLADPNRNGTKAAIAKAICSILLYVFLFWMFIDLSGRENNIVF